ncbi:Uma2 family endonuclease [Mucilaginibacter mali]|uniref:Uma2 family endonuclease n=1 Tax=Mucilaginibacter mali TaxID=2740462 RepID=A0A7D4QC72_9SPHI|nr:Uma2 family endonuclease [Mucilaginibacter mali]QKJ32085.1 Uma2 family endonuclease [Mucilaginibacter mali]
MNIPDIPRTAMDVFEMLPEGTLCEVIDNALYMSPSPTTEDQRISMKLSSRLDIFVSDNSLGEVFAAPYDVYLDNGASVVQPDFLFVKAERESIVVKKGIVGSPDFVIEILSSNIAFDKETKLNLYQRNAIPEYFIINPETKTVLHYLLVDGIYQLQESQPIGQLNIKQLDLRVNF